MVIILCRTSSFLLGRKPVKRPAVDLLHLVALFLVGQNQFNANYFDRELILNAKHRRNWIRYFTFKLLANKGKVAPKITW